MDYDQDKVDEVVLALMYLTLHEERDGRPRSWKSFDWNALNRLHEKRWIDDPKNKAQSVVLTEEGLIRSQELFESHFGNPPQTQVI